MLTHHDVTVPNAIDIFEEVKDTGISHIGFKDIGMPLKDLKRLVKLVRREDMNVYLEVVSETEEAAIRSTKRAIEMGVDYLIGGTYAEKMLELIGGSDIKCFPYIGTVIGHPCILRGTIEEIVKDAKKAEMLGAHGINLLAYRYSGNVDRLITSVQNAVNIPLITAGSIDSFERIRKVVDMKIWAFTIGGAVMEKKFLPEESISDQILAVLHSLR
jgi:NAD(P)H-dependent flavin oxidoreductase YrpB (nitropropane dioxygenase family)